MRPLVWIIQPSFFASLNYSLPSRYPFPNRILVSPRHVTSPWQSIHKEKLLRITISSWFLLIFIRCPALEGNEDRQDCLVFACTGQRKTFALQLAAFSMKVITVENKKKKKKRKRKGEKKGRRRNYISVSRCNDLWISSYLSSLVDEPFQKFISTS